MSAFVPADGLEGVTFADSPGQVFVPLREAAQALGMLVEWDEKEQKVVVGAKAYKESDFQKLYDGTKLISVKDLEGLGATVVKDEAKNVVTVTREVYTMEVVQGQKRVEVSINEQELKAWQGSLLVMETNISSGRSGHRTPQGKFTAGPAKSRMHYSRLYDNAPMPWSVQVHGDVFIHGYHSVPRRPASHGCIRMPLGRKNAAKYFYDWVDLGTPVWIMEDFTEVTSKQGTSEKQAELGTDSARRSKLPT